MPKRWATPRIALYITEHVRARLARQLCHANLAAGGYLPLIALSPDWEQAFAESIVGQGEERQLAMAPSQLQQFIQAVRERFEEATAKNEVPVLLTAARRSGPSCAPSSSGSGRRPW